MKVFRFRLDQALRWRAAQFDLEKSRTAALAKRLSDLRSTEETLRKELSSSTFRIGPVADGFTLENFDAWTAKTRRQILELEAFSKKAEADLIRQTQIMLEANRRHRVIEKLKQGAQTQWNAEFLRELESFASDTFSGTLQSKKRARSSSG
jgi:capsule polysaccharide export protein KpsE/RkpR